MFMEIVSIVVGIILMSLGGYIGGNGGMGMRQALFYLLDAPSLILILVFTAPVLLRGGLWKDFVRAWKLLKKDYTCHLSELRRTQDVVEMLQKQIIYASILSMLLSLIIVLHMLTTPEALGPNLAVAILTMIYGVILEMLLLPLQLEVKRRIIDYMDYAELDAEDEKEEKTTGDEKA